MMTWIDPLSADHTTGLELQIQECIVRRERARLEGWTADVHAAELEISALQLELDEQKYHQMLYQRIVIRGAGFADPMGKAHEWA